MRDDKTLSAKPHNPTPTSPGLMEEYSATRKQRSLVWSCGLALLSALILALAVFCYADYHRDRQIRREHLYRLRHTISWQLAQIVALPLWEHNASRVAGLVESVMNGDGRIEAVQVIDSKRTDLMLERGRDDDWRPTPISGPPEDENLAMATSDVVHGDEAIGRVTVWVTDRFEQQALNNLMAYRLGAIVVVATLLSVVIGYVFRRIVVLPLRSVESYAFRVSNGEENARMPRGYFPAELENLLISIERLVSELAAQYNELLTSNSALAATKEQYQNLFQNAIEGIYQASMDGKLLVVNPAMAHMFGYESPESFIEHVENSKNLYVDRGDHGRFINKLLAESRVNDFEVQYKRKDGKVVWISETAKLGKSTTEVPFYIYGMTQDVTNRHLAEDALRESEEKYRALMECANDAVFVHSFLENGMPGPFHDVNKEACRRLGYTHETLMRMSPLELDDPRYIAEMPKVMAQLRQEGYVIFETAHMARDGRSIPVEVSSRCVELHGKLFVLSIARDITERKRSEALLLESEARLRSQLESILSPEADIDSLDLDRILNIPAIQSLLNRFVELTDTSIGLIDIKGKVLIPAGWQDICTKFHRVMEQTGEMCVESDANLTKGLKKGEYVSTKCGNGMWHVFTPLYIGDRHVANIFVGQFFYDDEDVDSTGFWVTPSEHLSDSSAYLEALSRVPRFSRFKVEAVMQFLVDFAEMVSHLGYGNLKLAKALWEQKRVEEELRQHRDELAANQRKLSLTMSMAKLVSWEYDYEKDKFLFDQKFFSLFGGCETCDEDGSMTPEAYGREYLRPEKAHIVRKGITRFALPGMPATSRPLELAMRGCDGQPHTCIMKCTMIRDDGGRPCKIIGATQDITEQKLADVALRESEARYRGLVESLPLGVTVVSADMRIMSVNAKMRQWHPQVELRGQPLCYHVLRDPPREVVCDGCPIPKTLQDGLQHEGMTSTTFKGDIRNFRIISSPIRNARGQIIGVIKIQEDITERVRAEDTIRNSERKYRTLLENIPLNIIYKDKSSVYRAVNDHCANIFDLTLECFPGLTDFDLFDSSLAERYRADDKRIMESGIQEEFDEPYRYQDREGIFHVIKTPIRDDKGNIESILVIFWDVTESRRIEAAMREAEKMAAVGTLAGGIAHDFNNILGSIANLALLARREIPSENSARQDLEQILESANVGKELVRQLLTFRRPEKEIRRTFDPATVVRRTLGLMKPSIATNIEIREDLVEGRGMIEADPSQFRQVVLNLCTNAVDAMRGHPGILSVSLEFCATLTGMALPQCSLAPGRYAALCVGDNGDGIDPAIRDRIFEPFVTSKSKRRGTGLGLAVVHSIVARHDGAVAVQSRHGEGSIFTVYFPACDIGTLEPEREAVSPVRGTGRILLVDDEIVLAQTNQRLLEHLGYEVTVCNDGDSAFTIFNENPQAFDLVMTDLTMPGMNGKVLAMRLLGLRPGLPIILCTGYSELFSPEEAKSIGVSEYILKPVDWNSLSVALERLMAR